MNDRDLALRNLTYGLFVELGRAPTAEEVASAHASPVEDVRAGWRRLHDEHAIVLAPDAETLRMANPFCCSTASSPPHAGGTTSASPEGR